MSHCEDSPASLREVSLLPGEAAGLSCRCSSVQSSKHHVSLRALKQLNLIRMVSQVQGGTQVPPGDEHPFPGATKATGVR